MPKGVPKNGFRKTKNNPVGTRVAMQRAAVEVSIPESRFTINERFEFVSDMVSMLALGEQASVVVTGPGGLGKSYTVLASLNEMGFQDITEMSDLNVGDVLEDTYVVIKGYSTPKGLYRALYENRNGVIVFDDCDSVLKDPVSVSLLKAALDSYSRRFISWRADFKDDELPNCFEFKGRVVFISNLSSWQLDQAIITRAMAVDLSMTTQQKVDRMKWLLGQKDFMPDFPMAMKMEALDLITSLQTKVKELSLRTLIQVTKIRKGAKPNRWKALAEYTICG